MASRLKFKWFPNRVPLKPDPADEAAFFDEINKEDEAKRSQRLRNDRQEQENRQSQQYFRRAYRFAKIWIGFLIVFIPVQMLLKCFKLGLSDNSFIAVIGALTATVLGFWWLVGRHLFPGGSK